MRPDTLDGAGPGGEPGQQARRVLAERRAGQDLVREVLQDDRAARQRGRLGDHFLGGRAGHGQLGEHLVQPLGRPQLGELGVDDPGVHGLSDLDELGLPLQHDQRQPVVTGGRDQRGRQAPGVARAELDRQAADADRGKLGHIPAQPGRVVGQRDPGGQHELAAAQQVSGLG